MEDPFDLSMRSTETLKSNEDNNTHLPKFCSAKALVKSEPDLKSEATMLTNLIYEISYQESYNNFDRLDNAFTILRHRGTLALISQDILLDFVKKITIIIKANSEIEFSKNYLFEAKQLIRFLEPSKVYLNLAGCPDIDQRVLIDELLESILKLIQNSLEKIIIPLCRHPTEELKKLLETKRIKHCMASLCTVLEYLNSLIQKKVFQDHWLISISDLLIKVLFSEGAELLHLACCYTLSSIINHYSRIAIIVLKDIITNLPTLTSDPNSAIGAKNKKVFCKDYSVAEGIEVKFSTFMLVFVIQSSSSLKDPIQIDGGVDSKRVNNQLQETLALAQLFINAICTQCFKTHSESQEYRTFLDVFIQDLLKLLFRPEFPIAYQLINILSLRFFSSLKSHPAIIRHFIIDELCLIAASLKSSIHEVKQFPIVPQQITKVPYTSHPSEMARASMCICNKGCSLDNCLEMVQCEECWKWFHLDCVGLEMENYTDENWYCDDCRLFECLEHIEILKPLVRKNKIRALPKKIVVVNKQYKNVFRELIGNYLITSGGRLEDSSRCMWLASWVKGKPENKPENKVNKSNKPYPKSRTKYYAQSDIEYDPKPDIRSETNSLQISFPGILKLWQTPVKTPNLPRLSEKGTVKLVRQYLLSFDLGRIFLHIQDTILGLLTEKQPLTRAKAIKSICAIVTADPDCLVEGMIKSIVTERLLDSSISVREATVELLGKFVTYKSEFSDIYYAALLERLKDKGSSVRKKVIKILRDIIACDPDHQRTAEIFCEVVKRISDHSEGIRDAVTVLFEEACFHAKPERFFMSIVNVLSMNQPREPLIILFKVLLKKNPGVYLSQLNSLTQISTDHLIASSSPSHSIIYSKILEMVSLASPGLLVEQISTLHQFLTPSHNSSEESEVLTSICIIIGEVSDYLSTLNQTEVNRIEGQLLHLVYTQGSAVLTQALSALCKIVQHCSGHHSIIIDLIQKCYTLLASCMHKKDLDAKITPSLFRALLALGLCVRFYNSDVFETLQVEEGMSFKESIFLCLEKYANSCDEGVREKALEALSLAWIRFPGLLRRSEGLIRSAWKVAKTSASKIKMLQVFYEFLAHCENKLIGAEDDDRENVVAIIQGYIEDIVNCSWSCYAEVREAAAKVLKIIFLQGQIHVSKMISILFCMLGDENCIVKDSGFFCIEKIFVKTPDLITINLQNSLKEVFSYQKKIFSQRSLNDSFFPKLYSLIKPKKLLRARFVSQIIALLEPSDPCFTEFLCELLTTFPYTTYEELAPIISYVSGKIQSSAFRLLRILKIRKAHKEPLKKDALIECLLQIQMILMKNYLVKAYQLKNTEETQEKNIQKIDGVEIFTDIYEELRSYHCMEEICDVELKNFSKHVINYLVQELLEYFEIRRCANEEKSKKEF